ncbi:MAG: TolC family protein [Sandaracinus sp.]|nr:TolC family protein [Sandaracinus sp.]
MREAVRAREAGIRAELGRQYPQLAVQGNVDVANPNNRIIPQQEEFRTTWDISVVLRWSPNEFGQARQRVEQARAQILALESDMAALEDAVRLEVAQAHEELRASLLAFEAAVVGLAAADESYRVRREQLEAGAAVTADVIDAESELTRARLDVVDAGIAVRLAKVRLDLASGVER